MIEGRIEGNLTLSLLPLLYGLKLIYEDEVRRELKRF